MTQTELVLSWVKEFGFIDPAHRGGTIYKGTMFGSETTRVCRKLEEKGFLKGYREGKFVNYSSAGNPDHIREVVEKFRVMSEVKIEDKLATLF